MLVRDLQDGQDIDGVLAVRAVEARLRRDGQEYLRIGLGDRSGELVAMVWDGIGEARACCAPGQAVHVRGRFERHPRWGAQLALRSLGPAAPGSFDPAALHDGPPMPVERMERDLDELVATVQDRHLRALLDALLSPATASGQRYRRAPAAKHYHQAYAHGLLEHCLTVAQGVGALAALFPHVDRDLAVTGALLHDIGKLEAYAGEPAAIDLTDLGRLQGEIALGYYVVRRAIEGVPGFPEQTARALLHIILSHHGSLEHGSPVVPSTREATLVHMIDNLGGRLGSFDRLEKQLAPGTAWTGYDRALGASAWFGSAPDAAEQREAA